MGHPSDQQRILISADLAPGIRNDSAKGITLSWIRTGLRNEDHFGEKLSIALFGKKVTFLCGNLKMKESVCF